MYIDGHEHVDVVEYQKEFIECQKEYERCFIIYDNDGFSVAHGVQFWLILVMHDESTFYENDCHKTLWINSNTKAVVEKKGEGQLIMVSKFLTSEWGQLKEGDE